MEEFKKIVARSFIKAYEKNPLVTSKTALSKKISEAITEKEIGEPNDTHYKSLLNYYDYFFNEGKKQEPTETMINKLLNFLAYDSLDHFVKNQPVDESYLEKVPFVKDISIDKPDMEDPVIDINDNNNPKSNNEEGEDRETPWKKIIITISFVSLILVVSYFGINQQNKECMIWKDDHYEKSECDSNGISMNYNQNWINDFKKVNNNDSIRDFFEEGGKPLYWYYKENNQVELFTMPGNHPIKNVKLRPITQIIVRKYILKE